MALTSNTHQISRPSYKSPGCFSKPCAPWMSVRLHRVFLTSMESKHSKHYSSNIATNPTNSQPSSTQKQAPHHPQRRRRPQRKGHSKASRLLPQLPHGVSGTTARLKRPTAYLSIIPVLTNTVTYKPAAGEHLAIDNNGPPLTPIQRDRRFTQGSRLHTLSLAHQRRPSRSP